MLLSLPFAIWLSLVLAGLAVFDCALFVLQACVLVLLGDTVNFSVRNLGMESCGTMSALCSQVCRHYWEMSSLLVVFVHVYLLPRISSEHRNKSEASCPRQPLGSCVQRVQSGLVPLNNRSVPTCTHRLVCTLGRLALSLCHLVMEPCARGSSPPVDRIQKAHVAGNSCVPVS